MLWCWQRCWRRWGFAAHDGAFERLGEAGAIHVTNGDSRKTWLLILNSYLRSVVLPWRQFNLASHFHLKRLPRSGACRQRRLVVRLLLNPI
jgi:hypothetical protein